MTTEDEEGEDEEFFDDREQYVPPPHQGVRVHLHPILLPRILLAAPLPQLTLGKKTLQFIWHHGSLIHPLPGDMWLFLSSCFLVLVVKKGEKD
jgi:hypothetical protein